MLRTELFKTVDRAETRFIAVRDSLTQADPAIDAEYMDTLHCRQGRLGLGWHFLISVSGVITLARDIETCGSHSRNMDNLSVAIGIVGGIDENGDRINSRNQEQLEALADLLAVLTERYPDAEVHDAPSGFLPPP